ncbi:Plb3p [Sugiyamaella lignohabitans]|uniref:Lysophospholipase n=1 Tax=Sugiyamaella lignohabitans TaxID=796027 RepID=A0A161HJ84_9ASCO|nr:Plb3p [Sugiyamaella lignohabitans]ANB11418.1 Plb3p [Sugiyamaella lignohabitans]
MVVLVTPIIIISICGIVHAWSPTGGYAPGPVSCPEGSLLRSAESLLEEEVGYVNDRLKIATTALVDFVNRADRLDFDAAALVKASEIRVGLAFSGGGYRAMLVGAGEFAALDSRTEGTLEKGHLGGLLQASTYITGLSGGSWLMASIYMQNFTTINSLIADEYTWDLSYFAIDTQGGLEETERILTDPMSKMESGFRISLTDIWGRILSQQMISLPDRGASLEWSDMINWDWFKQRQAPYPIFLATDRMPIENLASPDASIFEITPYELGSFDPEVYAFTPLKYLGTELENGVPTGDCISGYDNAGFLFGTSSTVFDLAIHNGLERISGDETLSDILDPVLNTVTADVAIYKPNPFLQFSNPVGVSSIVNSTDTLYLVDGGENGIVAPMQPLLHPSRDVDVMFVFDTNMDDTPQGWPNGSSLINQYRRQFSVQADPANPYTFPYVPDSNTFINEGLVSRPTFFGCDGQNLTSLGGKTPPLLVYMANHPYSYWSNVTVMKLTYGTDEALGMINNGYNIMTQLNGTRDPDWHSCVSCAIVKREMERRHEPVSQFCRGCFEKYCWDGTVNSTNASRAPDINPSLLSTPIF